MRLAIVQSATTVRLEGATADSKVWRWGCRPVVGDLVATETFGTQLVVIATMVAPTPIRAEAKRATGSTTLAAGAWTTYPLDTAVSSGGGSWSPSKWTCPRAGTYLIVGSVRLTDAAVSRSVGVGVGTASADGPSVLWGDMGGARSGRQVSRVMDLAIGDEVRIFLYSETQPFVTHSDATMGPAGQSLAIRELP